MTTYIDLYDVAPDVKVNYSEYWASERDVITPALEAAGYQIVGSWYTGDGDSFGPLTRGLRDRGVRIKHGT
jgi:hypothetical protein